MYLIGIFKGCFNSLQVDSKRVKRYASKAAEKNHVSIPYRQTQNYHETTYIYSQGDDVSIPYRQTQNDFLPRINKGAIQCFNSLQVDSKQDNSTGKYIINFMRFNSLQVDSKLFGRYYENKGYIKGVSIPYRQTQNSGQARRWLRLAYLFQFLIGRLKTRQGGIKSRFLKISLAGIFCKKSADT